MAFKDLLTKQSYKLLQDPRVKTLMQDPRVMKGVMKAIQIRGRVQERIDDRVESLASSLNLATKKELREMKRALRKMEVELQRAKRS